MKKTILILGVIITLVGVFQSGRYFSDYNTLSNYGKGYVWGTIILFLIGVILIYWGLKKKKTS